VNRIEKSSTTGHGQDQAQEDGEHGGQQPQVQGPAGEEQGEIQAGRHHGDVDEEREAEAGELAEEELVAR
jgi:hypothetical protein